VPGTTFLLAGQGAYRPGLFASPESRETVEPVLAAVDAVAAEFGHPGVRTLLSGATSPPAAELARTDPFALQLAVFAASLGEFRLATRSATPDVLVGHSIGELAALTAAGGFDIADGARLVCLRSQALAQCVSAPGGMLAVDMIERRAAHLIGAVGDRQLAVAVLNAPARTVIAGPDSGLDLAAAAAAALGVRTVRLPAPYAFHSPGLAVAAHDFAETAASIGQRPLRMPVFSPLLGDYVADTESFLSLLVRHLTTRVDFLAAIRALHGEGMRVMVECGRSGLGDLVRASVPDVLVGGHAEKPAPPAVSGQRAVSGQPVVSGQPAVSDADMEDDDMVTQLRELYATELGYPFDAVEPDADLEADLGVDSLKRAEMLGKVAAQFSLPESVQDGRFMGHATLAELADMITQTLGALR
jgi:[acyl-carrier-protein] S-malonyltransferase